MATPPPRPASLARIPEAGDVPAGTSPALSAIGPFRRADGVPPSWSPPDPATTIGRKCCRIPPRRHRQSRSRRHMPRRRSAVRRRTGSPASPRAVREVRRSPPAILLVLLALAAERSRSGSPAAGQPGLQRHTSSNSPRRPGYRPGCSSTTGPLASVRSAARKFGGGWRRLLAAVDETQGQRGHEPTAERHAKHGRKGRSGPVRNNHSKSPLE